MNYNERIITGTLKVLRCFSDDRVLNRPVIERLDDDVLHGMFRQNVVDFSLGSTEQVSTMSRL